MTIYAVKKGQFNGFFFDEENRDLAIGDYNNPECECFDNIVDAINYLDIIFSKVYAVYNGHIKGIFLDWPSCQAQTNGFPSASFKSFYSTDEALDFLFPYKKDDVTKKTDTIIPCSSLIPNTGCVAFVDGSFNPKTNEYGWGAVMYLDGNQYCISGSGNDPEDVLLRNVAGEIAGVQRAIAKAIDMGYTSIDVYYDYAGIEMWATGKWKRNKKQTKQYYEYVQSVKDKIDINFIKVKAHTGIELNELVDRLAKTACGIE